MNPEDRQTLQKTYELAQENNKILHGIRRSHRLASLFRVLYWVLIIAASVGAFYYIQPYLDSVMKAYSNVKDVANKIPGLTN